MKKTIFVLMMILALALTACGSDTAAPESVAPEPIAGDAAPEVPANETTDETAPEAATSILTTEYEDSIGVQLQLSAGTFLLEETDLAVDAEQATELLPLWQVLNSLNTSGTAASEEVTALVLQIQETMSAEQIDAIAAMQLTREDMSVVIEEYDLMSTMGDGTTAPDGATPGMGGGSGVPGAGGGAGNRGNDTGMTPDQIATAQAERKAGTDGNVVNSRLAGAMAEGLIALLQNK